MSLTRPAEDQIDWQTESIMKIGAADSRRARRDKLAAEIDDATRRIVDSWSVKAVADLLRAANQLADLTIAAARDEGKRWDQIADTMTELPIEVYRRFSRVNSEKPDSPVDEGGSAEHFLMLLEGATASHNERDDLIRAARNEGATYADLEAVTGLGRARLDRIVHERDY